MLRNPALSQAHAYAKTLPELSAVASERLLTINIDVTTAITTVMGALPRLRSIHTEMQARWRDCDAEQLDRLEQYALALQHAHTLYQATKSQRKERLGPLASELAKLRDRLLVAAVPLAKWGLIDGGSLARCRVTRGYRSLAGSVCVLVAVYRGRWATVAGKTPVTLDELDRAAALALQLLVAVGVRKRSPVAFEQAVRIRQQAFTLFVEAYDEARHAVRYLRKKQSEADRIAPSLYAGRGRRDLANARDEVGELSLPLQTSS